MPGRMMPGFVESISDLVEYVVHWTGSSWTADLEAIESVPSPDPSPILFGAHERKIAP
jgi:hypothetical protein